MDKTSPPGPPTAATPPLAAGDIAAYFGAGHAVIYDRRIRQRCPTYEGLHRMLGSSLQPMPEAAQVLESRGFVPRWRSRAPETSSLRVE